MCVLLTSAGIVFAPGLHATVVVVILLLRFASSKHALHIIILFLRYLHARERSFTVCVREVLFTRHFLHGFDLKDSILEGSSPLW